MVVELTVEEALQSDVGRQIARVPQSAAEKIGVKTGDIVAITGERTTYAKVWRSHPKDIGKKSIRLDPVLRRNSGVNLNDKVRIQKAEARIGITIVLSLGEGADPTDDLRTFLSKSLMDKVMTNGDFILISLGLGKSLTFMLAETEPSGPIIFTEQTEIVFSNDPFTEVRDSPASERGIVSYEDIGGLEPAIKKIREMVELPLKYPEIFNRLGISAPSGVLLHGPPGTGKTLLARAVANETNSFFQSINGPEIISRFYGESENKLREIFEEAARRSPSVIFIDEIDSIAPKRSGDTGESERRIVSQLLTLMDGIDKRGEIVVIAATNRPDAIDEALRRGGRFDREIEIGVPDEKGRIEILQILTRGMPLAEDVDLHVLAEKSYGYVGADFSSLAKEAAMMSLSRALPQLERQSDNQLTPEMLNSLTVSMDDFEKAMSEIIPSGMREIFTDKPKSGFDKIIGFEKVKERLRETIIWPLKQKDLFKQLEMYPSKGIILYGPPGTGKTTMAKAISFEAETNFISIYGPQLLNKYVGETEKEIRRIFKKAKVASPSIILFDEIDAFIGIKSENSSFSNESIISQLLTEFDLLDEWSEVFVIATTTNPSRIPMSLRRPGRFEVELEIGLPDDRTRRSLIENHLSMVKSADLDLEVLVARTKGMTPSEIISVIRNSKLRLLKRSIENEDNVIKQEDLIVSIDAVVKDRSNTKKRDSFFD